MHKPFFSIIVCTRNRPDIIKYCIFSLKNQSFEDFEIILSDNSDPFIQEKNLQYIKKLNFEKLKYIRPPDLLSMPNHYEFALQHTTGEYVGCLTDKNLLKKNSLKDIYKILKNNKVDIFNYNYKGCLWLKNKIFKWKLQLSLADEKSNKDFEEYSSNKELLRRLNFETSFRSEGAKCAYGKIFFGFYHKDLIKRIRESCSFLFHGLSCDYTSAALALNFANKVIYCHQPMMIAINNYAGNGKNCSTVNNAMVDYLKTCSDNIESLLEDLPIPNVYTLHNLCAYDYLILNRIAKGSHEINLKNLAERVCEDLQCFPFSNDHEKKSLLAHFSRFIEEHNIVLDQDNVNLKHTSDQRNAFKKSFKEKMSAVFKVNGLDYLKSCLLNIYYSKFKGLHIKLESMLR